MHENGLGKREHTGDAVMNAPATRGRMHDKGISSCIHLASHRSFPKCFLVHSLLRVLVRPYPLHTLRSRCVFLSVLSEFGVACHAFCPCIVGAFPTRSHVLSPASPMRLLVRLQPSTTLQFTSPRMPLSFATCTCSARF